MRRPLDPRPVAIVLGVLGGVACGPADTENWDTVRSSIIYGDDDRSEALDWPGAALRRVATHDVGALIPLNYLLPEADGWIRLDGPNLGERLNLCGDEPWREQLSLALCTAVLVGADTILTAGHCVRGEVTATAFVRGYALGAEFPRVRADQVHVLDRVAYVRDGDISTESGADFAIAKLRSRVPLPVFELISSAASVALGDPVVVLGTAEGLPLKIDGGGKVYDAAPGDYFEITSDTFGGSSGSPVFSQYNEFLGIIVGGAQDYGIDEETGCTRRLRLERPEARGEIVVRAPVLLDALQTAVRRDQAFEDAGGCRWDAGARPSAGVGAGLLLVGGLVAALRASHWRRAARGEGPSSMT